MCYCTEIDSPEFTARAWQQRIMGGYSSLRPRWCPALWDFSDTGRNKEPTILMFGPRSFPYLNVVKYFIIITIIIILTIITQ